MKNIEPLSREYEQELCYTMYGKAFHELTEGESAKCRASARVMAYKKGIIPDGFQNFTIFDFDALSPQTGEILLDTDVAAEAKDNVCKYCWAVPWEALRQYETDSKKANHFLASRRIKLVERHKEGQNVVLFGDDVRRKGRTFIASLIMREAIFLKQIPGNIYTYGWIDFTQLVNHAKQDGAEYYEYKSCDWLVVDNINRRRTSANQTTWLIGLLNDFFIERFESKLPTIMTLKFDLRDKTFDPDAELGSGFARMVESPRTLKIALSKTNENANT